jgi:hypothetical protein
MSVDRTLCYYSASAFLSVWLADWLAGVILLYLKHMLYFGIGCKLCESTWWLQSLALKPLVNEICQLTKCNWTKSWILRKLKYWHGTGHVHGEGIVWRGFAVLETSFVACVSKFCIIAWGFLKWHLFFGTAKMSSHRWSGGRMHDSLTFCHKLCGRKGR